MKYNCEKHGEQEFEVNSNYDAFCVVCWNEALTELQPVDADGNVWSVMVRNDELLKAQEQAWKSQTEALKASGVEVEELEWRKDP